MKRTKDLAIEYAQQQAIVSLQAQKQAHVDFLLEGRVMVKIPAVTNKTK